ncbi:MAG: Unknown protein [uncultured Sulfurovum sp.]|uniref:Bacteriophage T5 Orf172 DNA-binding domain-containing protein n=1 Tax=uncultured Sulfurovum sp. TaxID=269237 RepID=A0A6S6T927_9BACT|nr:MAG: Unknown protein [uncultured Sulfurovum sp.]
MTYVYFIVNEQQSVVKIGVANKPMRRLKTFQTANHEALSILKVIQMADRSTAFELESALHKKFKKYHVRGEWFKLTSPLLNFIETYQETKPPFIDQLIVYLKTLAIGLGLTLFIVFLLNK